jgi:hypothetical protein
VDWVRLADDSSCISHSERLCERTLSSVPVNVCSSVPVQSADTHTEGRYIRISTLKPNCNQML